jgi:hypothetical protein
VRTELRSNMRNRAVRIRRAAGCYGLEQVPAQGAGTWSVVQLVATTNERVGYHCAVVVGHLLDGFKP